MTTQTFTFVDANSGYIWDAESGDTIEEAVKTMDAKLGAHGRLYDVRGPRALVGSGFRDGEVFDSAYYVFPGGIPEDADGQDPELIALVEARGCIATVVCSRQGE